MRKPGNSGSSGGRRLLHLAPGLRQAIDANDARRGLKPFSRSFHGSTILRMGPTKAEVLAMLDVFARKPVATGPVELEAAYLRAVERWEALPENAEGCDKSWVGRARRRWELHFAKARLSS